MVSDLEKKCADYKDTIEKMLRKTQKLEQDGSNQRYLSAGLSLGLSADPDGPVGGFPGRHLAPR